MSFAQWDTMPMTEQRHRLLLYLADIERNLEERDANTPWVEGPEDDWGE